MMFVVNRSDLHGVDPRRNPHGWAECCRRKEHEVVDMVNRHLPAGARIDEHRVISTASIPRWSRGEPRAWDGMSDVVQALLAVREALTANGADVSVLHLGILRFTELVRECDLRVAEHEAARQRAARAGTDLEHVRASAAALRAARVEGLRRVVRGFLETRLAEALDTRDDKLRAQLVRVIERFPSAADLVAQVATWRRETTEAVRAWCDQIVEALPRDMAPGLTGPRQARRDATITFLRTRSVVGIGEGGVAAATALRAFAKPAADAATKLGALLRFGGRAAPFVSIGASLADAGWTVYREHKGSREAETQTVALFAAGEQWADATAAEDPSLRHLGEVAQRLGRDREVAAQEQAAATQPLQEWQRRRATYQNLIDEATALLSEDDHGD
jgi:hypothetical protein